jgi:hypothetical protein
MDMEPPSPTKPATAREDVGGVRILFNKTPPPVQLADISANEAELSEQMPSAAHGAAPSEVSSTLPASSEESLSAAFARLGADLGVDPMKLSLEEVCALRERSEVLTRRLRTVEEQRRLNMEPKPVVLSRMPSGVATDMHRDKLTQVEDGVDIFSETPQPKMFAELCATPTLAFDDAAEPISGLVAGLDVQLAKCRKVVAEARERSAIPDAMTADEACALALYTAMSQPLAASYFHQLNSLLRGHAVRAARPYLPMLKLTMGGLAHLEPFVGNLWRGVARDLRAAYPKGARVTWWSFSSCTKDMELLEDERFLGAAPHTSL